MKHARADRQTDRQKGDGPNTLPVCVQTEDERPPCPGHVPIFPSSLFFTPLFLSSFSPTAHLYLSHTPFIPLPHLHSSSSPHSFPSPLSLFSTHCRNVAVPASPPRWQERPSCLRPFRRHHRHRHQRHQPRSSPLLPQVSKDPGHCPSTQARPGTGPGNPTFLLFFFALFHSLTLLYECRNEMPFFCFRNSRSTFLTILFFFLSFFLLSVPVPVPSR